MTWPAVTPIDVDQSRRSLAAPAEVGDGQKIII